MLKDGEEILCVAGITLLMSCCGEPVCRNRLSIGSNVTANFLAVFKFRRNVLVGLSKKSKPGELGLSKDGS